MSKSFQNALCNNKNSFYDVMHVNVQIMLKFTIYKY